MATQVSLNDGAVASAGALAIQTNGTTQAVSISTGQVATLAQNPILTSGTANGVAYLNGSKVLTTGSALVFDGTNLGVGVTPSAWDSGWSAIQVSTQGASFVGRTGGNEAISLSNVYRNGANWKYITSTSASMYQCGNGQHAWFTAPSGTAGNTISFTQAMTLDASGNLGIGTTSPAGGANRVVDVYGSGSSAINFHNATSGTTATDGGLVGQYGSDLVLYNYEAGIIQFGTSNTEAARIDSSGNLLVGQTSQSGTSNGISLTPAGAGTNSPAAYIAGAGTVSTAAGIAFYNTTASAYRFYVTYAGNINATNTTITAISDQRLKENIRDLDDGLEKVMALQPRKFDWKEGKGQDIKNARGFIAQEFETVFPDMIQEWLDTPPEGEEPYKAINANLIPTLVKAIQELKAEFDAYKASHP